jgi:hypothetical protein
MRVRRVAGSRGHQAVAVDLHAAVGEEGAAIAKESFALRGVSHQVKPEPRGKPGKIDAIGSLVRPVAHLKAAPKANDRAMVEKRIDQLREK